MIIQVRATARPRPRPHRASRRAMTKHRTPREKVRAKGPSSIAIRPAFTKGRVVSRTRAESKAGRMRPKPWRAIP
ncbi:hypothetical protein D3C87_1413770 [compost metagenome]